MTNLQRIKKNLDVLRSADDLAKATAQAASELQPASRWLLFKYQPGTVPFTLLFTTVQENQLPDLNDPKTLKHWISFWLDALSDDGYAYLLLSSETFSPEVKELLQVWQQLHEMGQALAGALLSEQRINYGNQFSQLLHDVESLINLFQNPQVDRATLQERIAYQKRLNKRLLFYQRELELFPTSVALSDFLEAFLQKRGIAQETLKIHYRNVDPFVPLTVDLELLDQAMGEILDNALQATSGDLSKIRIEIKTQHGPAQLALKEWLIISIIDNGVGILPDFLEWVTAPYFTTWKEKGHSGFGLSIAQKILEAHHGFLEIHSSQGSGCSVNLILPGFRADEK